jgi:hypothetical protein
MMAPGIGQSERPAVSSELGGHSLPNRIRLTRVWFVGNGSVWVSVAPEKSDGGGQKGSTHLLDMALYL